MNKLRSALVYLFVTLVSLGLAGCSDDDAFTESGAGPGAATGPLVLTLELVDQGTGFPTTAISTATPGELRATVTENGVALGAEIVTFSANIGSIPTSTGLTAVNGMATAALLESGVSGAGTATAKVTVNGVTAEASVNFEVFSSGGGTGLGITLALLDQATSTPTSTISSIAPGTLVATVTDNGAPVSTVVVSFTTSLGSVDAAAVTNGTGVATATLLDGGDLGTGVIATAEVTVGGVTVTAPISFAIVSGGGGGGAVTLDMGNGTDLGYTADVVDLGGIVLLSASGSLTATVNIVETSNANAAYTTTSESVSFTSTCADSALANMDSPVLTVGGAASSTYIAQGCVGTDTITASVTIGGVLYSAQANVTVQAATVGSIQFVSASEEVIAIQGTGGSGLSETSDLVFAVLDSSGNPVNGAQVNFALSTTVGGITISPSIAISDATGQVYTVVKSGTVNTSVQVVATVDATSISTQSVAVAISTGLPDQNSFSLSIETFNPNVWETNGVVVPLTIFVADHFNNPAPDGTAVAFTTEGGFIDGSCTTANGQCTVNWVSSDPRPSDGRVTILASAIGEEGFTDTNGTGRFDDLEPYTNLPEAWRDDDEDGVFDTGAEEFIDFNFPDGNYDDGLPTFYNGTLCGAAATTCDPSGALVHVRDSVVLVMASSFQIVTVFETAGGTDVTSGGLIVDDDGSITQIRIEVEDARGQVPPVGTTVSVSASGSTVVEVVGTASGEVINTNALGPFSMLANLKAGADIGADVIEIAIGVSGSADSIISIPVNSVDVSGPTVDSTIPAFLETGVAVDADISITFSEDMNLDTTTANAGISIVGAVSGALTGNWYYDSATMTAAFLATADMGNLSETYTVTVDGTTANAVTDLAGNSLNDGADYVLVFVTVP